MLPFFVQNQTYSSFQTKSTFAQTESGLPSFVPGLNLHKAKAVKAALSKLLEPLDFSTLESVTLPSGPTKKPITTVPVSSLIRAAFGYFGGSHDLLSKTGAVSAAKAFADTANNVKPASADSFVSRFLLIVLLFLNRLNKIVLVFKTDGA